MKIIYELLKIAIGVASGAGLVVFLNTNLHLFGGGSSVRPADMSYSDLAAINLTVATVVLGGVALIVAVAAVFGFQVIQSESVSKAEKRVTQELPVMLEQELGRMENDGRLSSAMERAMYSGGSREDGNSQSASDQ